MSTHHDLPRTSLCPHVFYRPHQMSVDNPQWGCGSQLSMIMCVHCSPTPPDLVNSLNERLTQPMPGLLQEDSAHLKLVGAEPVTRPA